MSIDPLQQLVHSRQADLLADAHRHQLAGAARQRRVHRAPFRSTTAGWLFAAAARLEASAARPHPSLH
jgi:hypothetical protein